MRILVAEDVQRASALAKARACDYDVLVLDRDLPELHGDAVCEAVHREQPETRILMLTAYGEVEDLVNGLALGADDYRAKPFAFDELVARVRALSRQRDVSAAFAGGGALLLLAGGALSLHWFRRLP